MTISRRDALTQLGGMAASLAVSPPFDVRHAKRAGHDARRVSVSATEVRNDLRS
jgi:hypothetical protein